jgi:hypothetical protein
VTEVVHDQGLNLTDDAAEDRTDRDHQRLVAYSCASSSVELGGSSRRC